MSDQPTGTDKSRAAAAPSRTSADDGPAADPLQPSQYAQIVDALERGRVRMESIENCLAANTDSTKRVEESTRDLVVAWQSMQGAMRVFETLAKLAKPLAWLASLAAAAGVAWTHFRGGR